MPKRSQKRSKKKSIKHRRRKSKSIKRKSRSVARMKYLRKRRIDGASTSNTRDILFSNDELALIRKEFLPIGILWGYFKEIRPISNNDYTVFDEFTKYEDKLHNENKNIYYLTYFTDPLMRFLRDINNTRIIYRYDVNNLIDRLNIDSFVANRENYSEFLKTVIRETPEILQRLENLAYLEYTTDSMALLSNSASLFLNCAANSEKGVKKYIKILTTIRNKKTIIQIVEPIIDKNKKQIVEQTEIKKQTVNKADNEDEIDDDDDDFPYFRFKILKYY